MIMQRFSLLPSAIASPKPRVFMYSASQGTDNCDDHEKECEVVWIQDQTGEFMRKLTGL